MGVDGLVLADELLEQANHLARRGQPPQEADLRRAVSTAYYALFHLLIAETVSDWPNAPQRAQLTRSFDHSIMKQACNAQITASEKYLSEPTNVGNPEWRVYDALKEVAKTFVQLQQARHTADYDLRASKTPVGALTDVTSAVTAFACWREIRQESMARAFLGSLLMRKRD